MFSTRRPSFAFNYRVDVRRERQLHRGNVLNMLVTSVRVGERIARLAAKIGLKTSAACKLEQEKAQSKIVAKSILLKTIEAQRFLFSLPKIVASKMAVVSTELFSADLRHARFRSALGGARVKRRRTARGSRRRVG